MSDYSYIDRGKLDSEILKLSKRDVHIALKGESKSGKSWLRQKTFPDAVVVQCRIQYSISDIYTEVLRQLGIARIRTGELSGYEVSLSAGASGSDLLKYVCGRLGLDFSTSNEKTYTSISGGVDDLSFIVEIIKRAGRRVVVEDFHYLNEECRKALAFDLKTLWDMGVYFVVVGIWRHQNYLLYLNADLAGRLTEVSLYWNLEELTASLEKGSGALGCSVPANVAQQLAGSCYGNIGILQSLALYYFLEGGIEERQGHHVQVGSPDTVTNAGLTYAGHLEAIYSNFADRVSRGIRRRSQSTRIYAHAMWTIFDMPDDVLIHGVRTRDIFQVAHDRESRIQLGNLRAVLRKFDQLQIDEEGRGLVLTFDEGQDSIVVVDRGVLFYRRYRTNPWPWENLAQSDAIGEQLTMGFESPVDD